MTIKILGTGCANCNKLSDHVNEAVKRLGIEATVEHVTAIQDIMAYGVMRTPAIVVDEQVKLFGKVASVEEVMALLK